MTQPKAGPHEWEAQRLVFQPQRKGGQTVCVRRARQHQFSSEHITALRCGIGRGGICVLVVKGRLGSRPKRKLQALPALQKGVLAAWLSVRLYFLKGRPRVSTWLSCRGLVAAKASMGGADPWADS